jgi:hypothetical protein
VAEQVPLDNKDNKEIEEEAARIGLTAGEIDWNWLKYKHTLIITNIGNTGAEDVSFDVEGSFQDLAWMILGEGNFLGTLLPGEQQSFGIDPSGERQTAVAICHVRWKDDRGDQSNTVKLHFKV